MHYVHFIDPDVSFVQIITQYMVYTFEDILVTKIIKYYDVFIASGFQFINRFYLVILAFFISDV